MNSIRYMYRIWQKFIKLLNKRKKKKRRKTEDEIRLKKTGTLIITLLIVSFLSFLAFSVIPGDAALSKLGTEATREQVEALQKEMGLDEPVLVRYGEWDWKVSHR